MTIQEQITIFLSSTAFAVAGASNDRNKFGNKVLRCYKQHNKTVFPLNPNQSTIEEIQAVSKISDLPPEVQSISIVTPPQITIRIVSEAIKHGIRNIWIQPGAEHNDATELCKEHGINLIANGNCILVAMGYHDH